jgi:transposase, IS30 family
MAQHVQLRIQTGLPIYFCDPHSPWQRGTNENTNGLLGQYFPKGMHFSPAAIEGDQVAGPSRRHGDRGDMGEKGSAEMARSFK